MLKRSGDWTQVKSIDDDVATLVNSYGTVARISIDDKPNAWWFAEAMDVVINHRLDNYYMQLENINNY